MQETPPLRRSVRGASSADGGAGVSCCLCNAVWQSILVFLQVSGQQVMAGTSNDIVVARVSGCLCGAACPPILIILQDLAVVHMTESLSDCMIKHFQGEKDFEVIEVSCCLL